MNRKNVLRSMVGTSVAALALGLAGCSASSDGAGGGGGGTAGNLTISGTLASAFVPASVSNDLHVKVGAMAVAVSDLKLYGVAISSSGITANSVDLGTNGSFSLTLNNAKGALVTLLFVDKTTCSDSANPASCDSVGAVKFQDSSKEDLNGNPKESSSIAITSDVSLGSLSINDDGEVVVPVSSISSSVSTTAPTAGTAFDFSGVWTIGKYTGALPAGYSTVKTPQEMSSGGDGGGPMAGMPITLIRLSGKEFTPNGSCVSETNCPSTAGTNGNQLYAISIWAGGIANYNMGFDMGGGNTMLPSQLAACGGKTGFTDIDARFNAGVNLDSPAPTISGQGTSLALSYGPYQWITSKTGYGGDSATAGDLSNPNNQLWMKNNATPPQWQQDPNDSTKFRIQSCKAIDFSHSSVQHTGWSCTNYLEKGGNSTSYDSGTDEVVYNIGLSGGCYDAAGKPVQVDWDVLQNISSGVQHSQGAASGLPTGFYTNTSTFTNIDPDGPNGIRVNKDGQEVTVINRSAMNFVCQHTGGVFSTLGSPWTVPTMTQGVYPKPLEEVVSFCREIKDTLTRYRCYADNFHQDGGGDGPAKWGTCEKQYHFNWGADTPAEFVMSHGRNKPDAAFITNLINYSPDGASASVYDEEREVRTVGGDGKEVFCPIVRTTEMKITKISDTQLLLDLSEGGRVEGLDNQACAAAARTEFKYDIQTKKFMFYLNKTQ
jgi:hypothetical protein